MTKDKVRAIVDALWDNFLKNPTSKELDFIKQINFLLFLRIIDEIEEQYSVYCERNSLPMRALFFAKDQQKFRWKSLQCLNESELYSVVKQEVFPFLKNFTSPSTIKSSSYQEALAGTLKFPIFESVLGFFPLLAYMKLQIFDSPSMLHTIVTSIQQVSFEQSDIKAFFYEYLLSKPEVINGFLFPQERIQQLMIDLVNPDTEEYIANPACMTGNFLMQILRHFDYKNIKLSHNKLHGFEDKVDFILCASMNMIMHNKKEQCIKIKNFFSHDKIGFDISEKYDVVICNPLSFHVSNDEEKLKSNYCIRNILEVLTINGRCAILLPEYLLFDNTESSLLQHLVDKNTVTAIISLHPDLYGKEVYDKMAILLLQKGGGSKEIFFYQLEPLDAPSSTEKKDVFSEAFTTWQKYNNNELSNFDKKSNYFAVDAEEVRKNNYDLRFARYKEPDITISSHELTKSGFVFIKLVQFIIILFDALFSFFDSNNNQKAVKATKESTENPPEVIADKSHNFQHIRKVKIEQPEWFANLNVSSLLLFLLCTIIFICILVMYIAIKTPLLLVFLLIVPFLVKKLPYDSKAKAVIRNGFKKIENIFKNRKAFNCMLTRELIRNVFFEMFGSPITNINHLDVKKLEDVCDIIDEVTPSGKLYSISEHNKPLPYLTVDEIAWRDVSTLPLNISQSIPRGDIIRLEKKKIQSIVPAHSIFFSTITLPYNDKLAKLTAENFSKLLSMSIKEAEAYSSLEKEPVEHRTLKVGMTDNREIVLSQGIKALIIKSNLINSKFLCYYLYYASPFLVEKMKLLAPDEKDSLDVDMEILMNFPIFLPPIEAQNKFVKKIKRLEKTLNRTLVDIEKKIKLSQ